MLASEELDEQGMVMDFCEVRDTIKQWIDGTLDHTMLLSEGDPLVEVLQQNGEKFYLMQDNPTAENIARLIFDYARQAEFPVVSVTLWESDSSFARYSG